MPPRYTNGHVDTWGLLSRHVVVRTNAHESVRFIPMVLISRIFHGSGSVACLPTPFPLPLLRRPPNLTLQCQSYRFHCVDLVVCGVCMYHAHAN